MNRYSGDYNSQGYEWNHLELWSGGHINLVFLGNYLLDDP